MRLIPLPPPTRIHTPTLDKYPTAELALIRKEYRSLEEEWAAGPLGAGETAGGSSAKQGGTTRSGAQSRSEVELEIDFCSRKLLLLRTRREEVEIDRR